MDSTTCGFLVGLMNLMAKGRHVQASGVHGEGQEEMKTGMIFWAASLLIYGFLLGISREYESNSLFYHFLLLSFPIFSVVSKRESLSTIGFRKGEVKRGALFCGLMVLVIAYQVLRRPEFKLNLDFYSLFSTVFFAPLTEELFFRGYLQPKFEERWSTEKGVFFVSFLFALIHVPKLLFTPLINPLDLIYFFIFGFFCGYARSETNSLIYPIVCHSIWNLFAS